MASVSPDHVELDPALRGGRPRLAVSDVVPMHLRPGRAPAEIAGRHDVPLSAVHAALPYDLDHRDEVDRTLDEDAAHDEASRRANPSRLQEKLAALGG